MTPTPASDERLPELERWDFKQTLRYSPDSLRAIRRLLSPWGPMVQSALGITLRLPIGVNELEFQASTFDDVSKALFSSGVVAVVSAKALASPVLLHIDGALAGTFLERELGGAGPAERIERALTPTETAVVSLLVDAFVETMQHAVRLQVPTVSLKIDNVENATQMGSFTSPTETVLTVHMGLRLGPGGGDVRLLLPFGAVEPFLPMITGGAAQRGAEEVPVELTPMIAMRKATIEARLGSTRIPLERVLALTPGEVIPLPTRVGAPIWLMVSGRPTYYGHRLGRVGIHLALQLAGVLTMTGPEGTVPVLTPAAMLAAGAAFPGAGDAFSPQTFGVTPEAFGGLTGGFESSRDDDEGGDRP